MDNRLARLLELIRNLQSPVPVEIKSGFDPQEQHLKRRCREVADDLRQFLEDYGDRDEDVTMNVYDRRLGDKVSALIEELEAHGLYPPNNLASYERRANARPLSPFAVGRLAKTLGTIGQK